MNIGENEICCSISGKQSGLILKMELRKIEDRGKKKAQPERLCPVKD
jgi:hypothetical protein